MAKATVVRTVRLPAFVIPGLLVIACALLSTLGSEVLQRETTTMLVYVVIVVGLQIFVGNSGVLSFGHMGFVMIAAYTTAILTISPEQKRFLLPDLPDRLGNTELSLVPAVLVAAGLAAAFGLVIAIPLMRLDGLAAAIAMLAVLLIVYTVVANWDSFTSGRSTMIGVPTDTTLTRACVFACLAIVLAHLYRRSRWGLRLRAARDDPPAAAASGVNVVRERQVALVVSAFVVGMGGFLYAQFLGAFNPEAFFFDLTFLTIAMLVVGGVESIAGAVVGTVVVSAANAGLLRVEDGMALGPLDIPERPGLTQAGVAVLLIVILVFRSKGLTRGREFEPRVPRDPDQLVRRARALVHGALRPPRGWRLPRRRDSNA